MTKKIYASITSLILCICITAGFTSCKKQENETELSNINTLSALNVEGLELIPEFDKDITSYSISIPYEISSLNIDAQPESDKAIINYSDNVSNLDPGINSIIITVTAEDGSHKKYTINVLRAEETMYITIGPKLSSLITDIELNAEFDPQIANYFATVQNKTTSVKIKAVSEDEEATVTVKGNETLSIGINVITIIVSNSINTNVYSITTYRLEAVSQPESKPGSDTNEGNDTNPNPGDGTIDNSGDNSDNSEGSGSDTNTPIPPKSNVNTLFSLSLSSGTMLYPAFNPAITEYTTTVSNTLTSLKILATAKDPKATVAITDGNLAVGTNSFRVVVKAENGVIKTYNLKVTRRTKGLDATNLNDIVAICYSTWFDPVSNKSTAKYSQRLISGFKDLYYNTAGPDCFYYWAKPALGFYSSSDKSIIKTHMRQLRDAGVDMVIIDNTNAMPYWASIGINYVDGRSPMYWDAMVTTPVTSILDTCLEMRKAGEDTPYIVFWNRAENDDSGWNITKSVYKQFYKEKYKDLFVFWNELPFFLTTNLTSGMPSDLNGKITVRKMWGLHSKLATSEWSFLNTPNVPSIDRNGKPEQICVCTAAQKTYMSVTSTATGRNHGITFYNQWLNAFNTRPKFVTLTWWNEWVAQPQNVKINGINYQWTDAYNQEYSRDIEPMSGGHGDKYYKWMCKYIEAYKYRQTCPRLVESGY